MCLEFVICGMEHSGTTLVSDLFRQVPGLDSGFEVGVLMCARPAEFTQLTPFAPNMLKGWGISQEALEQCCMAADHAEFYRRLKQASTIISPETTGIFDKTPRYIADLEQCMARCDVPFIITHKDPRAMVASDYKRAKSSDFDSWYEEYMPAKRRYTRTSYGQWLAAREDPRRAGRIASVGLEELTLNARVSMERIFAHVGHEFQLEYAVMDKLRYANTRGNTISADIVFEYMRALTKPQQARICSDFAEMEDWFYG